MNSKKGYKVTRDPQTGLTSATQRVLDWLERGATTVEIRDLEGRTKQRVQQHIALIRKAHLEPDVTRLDAAYAWVSVGDPAESWTTETNPVNRTVTKVVDETEVEVVEVVQEKVKHRDYHLTEQIIVLKVDGRWKPIVGHTREDIERHRELVQRYADETGRICRPVKFTKTEEYEAVIPVQDIIPPVEEPAA